MIDHDVKPGPLGHCQVCGSDDLRQIIDLGHQPLCDSLLSEAQMSQPETYYPLRLNQCRMCSLAQIDYVVPRERVYPADYPYRAGISWPVVAAHDEMAMRLVQRFGIGLCVDIGCNDGTLLSKFRERGCAVFGIEPTDIAKECVRAGIPVAQAFFDDTVVRPIVADHGQAHIVTMTNVFAHMAELGEVMRGVCALLASDGVLVIENHYLLDILERNQFDSIYHEHVRTYTLRSLIRLFGQYGMEVFDVERVPRYGGNIRCYIAWRGQQPVKSSVVALLRIEEAAGICNDVTWGMFRVRVNRGRDRFMQFLDRNPGAVAACSAPGRASTLLNYYGVTQRQIAWTGELEGSLKIGKYLPGCHIPVVSNRRLVEEQPAYVVMLAWHYAGEIAARLWREGVRSRLVQPLPQFLQLAQLHSEQTA